MDEYLLIAKVKAVHGTEGFVSIDSYSDFIERFIELEGVFVEFFGVKKEFIIDAFSGFEKKLILKFKGFDTLDDAALFVGKSVYIKKETAVKLSKDTYFIHDLIGSQVFLDSNLVGRITDVLQLPANDVYIVKDTNKKEILIPAIKSFVKSFDSKRKRLELVKDCELFYDDEN